MLERAPNQGDDARFDPETLEMKDLAYLTAYPGEMYPDASLDDRRFLRHIGQKKSRIISGMTAICADYDDYMGGGDEYADL